jgi:SNF2 family DNA or RNA helicase
VLQSHAICFQVIVFSQWTTMLDLLEVPLKQKGHQYRRLDGTMSVAARERAINDFEERAEVGMTSFLAGMESPA